jgi:hypothetical protein
VTHELLELGKFLCVVESLILKALEHFELSAHACVGGFLEPFLALGPIGLKRLISVWLPGHRKVVPLVTPATRPAFASVVRFLGRRSQDRSALTFQFRGFFL